MQSDDGLSPAVDAVLAASRVLMGIAARTLPQAAEVTLPQWRALAILEARREVNVNTLAALLGVDPSTCTRLCDRLVRKGLIEREFSPQNRREVLLQLSPAGSALVAEAAARRRAEVEALVGRLSPRQRRDLATGLRSMAKAAGEGVGAAWVLGWAD